MRIQLHKGTGYATLFRLLDHLQQHNLRNYWLDLRQETVTTLYIVGNKYSFRMPCALATSARLPAGVAR
ncbi:hypothetical protein LRS06_16965 [Hymenobacter sp. J193]|uniref:hypothetical protein n=1 Tax=Hymenobacter sp. J193 TaxID=2898429 RepID=UPI002151069F|nr:hypothetical protein [Hymenobacter sp. J193]MCR5889430.1 hypothetical protein [Hymenobacter sp. J193]